MENQAKWEKKNPTKILDSGKTELGVVFVNNPHLTDAFGIEPYNSELRPL